MSSQASQILSNFKLFSQKAESALNINKTQSVTEETTLKYKLTLGFLIGVVVVLVYFKREVLSKSLESWINISGVNEFFGNLWLSTHLTSAGELASTYVPKEFSEILGESSSVIPLAST